MFHDLLQGSVVVFSAYSTWTSDVDDSENPDYCAKPAFECAFALLIFLWVKSCFIHVTHLKFEFPDSCHSSKTWIPRSILPSWFAACTSLNAQDFCLWYVGLVVCVWGEVPLIYKFYNSKTMTDPSSLHLLPSTSLRKFLTHHVGLLVCWLTWSWSTG